MIFTTHYLQEADEAADRIILFNEGTIAADGTPEQIKNGMTKRTLSFTYTPFLELNGESAHTEIMDTDAAPHLDLIKKYRAWIKCSIITIGAFSTAKIQTL